MQTKQEFYDYVRSFNKQKGTYTSDELFEIGVEHKKLPQKEKDWKGLADFVGYAGTAESYRQFIIKNQKKIGTLPIKDAEKITESTYEYDFKDKTKIRDLINSYRSDLRSDARVEAFLDALKEAARNMKPLYVYPCKRPVYENNEAILLFSDLHIGVCCDNFYNKYNLEIACARVQKLIGDTINYCEKHNIKTLHVLNLGDLIHGSIHVTARIQAQFNVVEQVINAADIVSQMLTQLEQYIPVVTYRSCTDNHSRLIPNYKESIEEENLGTLIDVIVEERLKGAKSKVQFMKDNLDPSIMMFKLHTGETFMAAHGHLEKPDKVIDDFTGATRQLPDYVALSHFHAARMKAYNGATLFINGSIVGVEEYALGKRLFNKPEQSLLIFDDENIINIRIKLN